MATKLEEWGGGKTLVAGQLKRELFLRNNITTEEGVTSCEGRKVGVKFTPAFFLIKVLI